MIFNFQFSIIFCTFALDFEKYTTSTMNISDFWSRLRISKWGKYVLALVLFLVVYIFIGDQSMIRFVQRGREIRRMEEQRDFYNRETERTQREIQSLQHPDSLERYAREHYFMHMPEEDIYLVEEE